MKRSIFLLCILSAQPLWAARALLLSIENVGAYTDTPSPTVVRWDFRAAYQGTDVAGMVQNASLTVAVSTSTTPAQIQAAIVAAIQSEATRRGFTVPVGATILPSFQTQ